MKLILITIGLGFAVLVAEEQTPEEVLWTQYVRGGMSHDLGTNGGHAYYRVNRKTLSTFQDLRLFGYGLDNDSYVYLRYKTVLNIIPAAGFIILRLFHTRRIPGRGWICVTISTRGLGTLSTIMRKVLFMLKLVMPMICQII